MPRTLAQALAAELARENASTRKMLELLPEDRLDWRPHEKSWTALELAAHLAHIPVWGKMVMTSEELDLGDGGGSWDPPGDRAGLLELFDSSTAELQELLEGASDEAMLTTWAFSAGGHEIFKGPRVAAIRGIVANHAYHHRGQLSVYLRLLDVPLPPIYGPTADDSGGFG